MRVINERYQIIELLQSNGYGTTYLARDRKTEENVILKEVVVADLPEGAGAFKPLELLEREGQVLRELDHPGIPRFLDAFETDGERGPSYWLVQAHRPGRDLAALVASGWRGTVDDILQILRQTAEILQYLHDRVPLIIHRDVKPHNILYGEDGRVSLVDFGSVATQPIHDRQLAGSTIVGTPGYVPIEQFTGYPQKASDVYALGMVGIFLLTHIEPVELITADGHVRYRSLVNVDHPTLLDTLDRMTQPMVADRLRDMARVLSELEGRSTEATGPSRQAQVMMMASVATVFIGASALLNTGDTTESSAHTTPNLPVAQVHMRSMESVNDVPIQAPVPVDSMASSPFFPEARIEMVVTKEGQPHARTVIGQVYELSVSPIIVAPGRIRVGGEFYVDTEDEVSGEIIADVTVDRITVLATDVCQDDGYMTASARGPNGNYYVMCEDETSDMGIEVNVFGFEKTKGLHRINKQPVRNFNDEIGFDDENFEFEEAEGAYDGLPRLVVGGGAPLHVASALGHMNRSVLKMQPIHPGVRSFQVVPPELTGASPTPLIYYLSQDRLHALYPSLKSRQGRLSVAYVPVVFSSRGSRALSPLPPRVEQHRDGSCLGTDIRVRRTGSTPILAVSVLGEHGASTSVIQIPDALPVAGPTVSPAHLETCMSGEGVIELVHPRGRYTLRTPDLETQNVQTYLTCDGSNCVVMMHEEGNETLVFRFTL